AVAAVLLALVQVGRMFTLERAITPRGGQSYAKEQLFEQPSQASATVEPARAGTLDKSDQLAAGKPKDLALAPPSAASETRSKVEQEFKRAPATVAPAETAQAGMAAKETSSETTVMNAAAEPRPTEAPAPELANRKLIRNANVELEIVGFDDAVQKITAFA